MRAFGITVVVFSSAALAVGGTFALQPRGAVDQPIAFNHSKHVEGLGLECTTCHLYAVTGTRATIPNIEVRKIYRVPTHVYFSHRRHTSVAEIECETCHGAIGEKSTPVSRPIVKITMDRCVECHRLSGASTDCISCHR